MVNNIEKINEAGIEKPKSPSEIFWDKLEKSIETDCHEQSVSGNVIADLLDNLITNNPKEISGVVERGLDQEGLEEPNTYTDDKGKIYRIGNELCVNNTYEINGYRYITDVNGRIVSAEGRLQLKDRVEKLPIKDTMDTVGKGYQLKGDDRGHLIADRFGGSNGLENLIPQDAKINQKDFKNFESDLAREVKNGRNVEVWIEPLYDNDSRRPNKIAVTYSIDGDVSERIFTNG